MSRHDAPSGSLTSTRWLPYVLTGVGLVVGLVVLLFEPLPWSVGNAVVGWAVVAVALGSVYFLIARHGGPGERGPEF